MEATSQSGTFCHEDEVAPVDAVFVGLAFKEGVDALDSTTLSGSLVDEIVEGLPGMNCWRTNLVDHVVHDDNGRLRNPTDDEIDRSWSRFRKRLDLHSPRVVVALGKITAQAVFARMAGVGFGGWAGRLQYSPLLRNGQAFVAAHHPSHIAVYRRKERSVYITALRASIKQAFEGGEHSWER